MDPCLPRGRKEWGEERRGEEEGEEKKRRERGDHRVQPNGAPNPVAALPSKLLEDDTKLRIHCMPLPQINIHSLYYTVWMDSDSGRELKY